MKRILYILIIQFLISNDFESIGAFTENANSFESISMSGTTTSWITGVSSMGSNPAGLAKPSGLSRGLGIAVGLGAESMNVSNYSDTQFPYFAIGYSLKKPLIRGTNLYAGVGISYQSRSVNGIEGWSSNQDYEGSFSFSESAMSVAFSLDLDPLSFGFKWVNFNQNFGEYGSQNSNDILKPIGFGIQYNLTKKIKFGIEISKVSEVGTYDYSIGKSKAGVSYILNDKKDFIAVDYEKLSNDNGNLSIGYKKNITDEISLTTGLKNVSTDNDNYNHLSFGISYQFVKSMDFSIAMKQNINSDILDPLSRILYFSISYKYQ